MMVSKKKKPIMVRVSVLGLAPPDESGEKRITRGKRLLIVGGDKETHERMQEIAIKTDEKLSQKGQSRDRVDLREYIEVIKSVRESIDG